MRPHQRPALAHHIQKRHPGPLARDGLLIIQRPRDNERYRAEEAHRCAVDADVSEQQGRGGAEGRVEDSDQGDERIRQRGEEGDGDDEGAAGVGDAVAQVGCQEDEEEGDEVGGR